MDAKYLKTAVSKVATRDDLIIYICIYAIIEALVVAGVAWWAVA